MRDSENVITYNGVFVVDQSEEDISDCKGLRDVAMATKFWPKLAKNHKIGHIFSCMHHIRAEFCFEIGFVPSGNSPMTLAYTRDKGALPWQPILALKLL